MLVAGEFFSVGRFAHIVRSTRKTTWLAALNMNGIRSNGILSSGATSAHGAESSSFNGGYGSSRSRIGD